MSHFDVNICRIRLRRNVAAIIERLAPRMFVPADDEASSAQAFKRPSDIPPGVAETLAQRLLAFEHCLSGFGVGMDQGI